MYRQQFDSLDHMARELGPHLKELKGGTRPEFRGIESWDEAMELARVGWQGPELQAAEIAEAAISDVERESEGLTFSPKWDVTGSQVDISTYLSGEPECMVDFAPIPVPRDGRVITLCASIAVSGMVTTEAIKERGFGIVCLALALQRIGLNVELWADDSTAAVQGRKAVIQTRVLVKGANDELDLAKVMFAFAHPAMLRAFGFASFHYAPYVGIDVPNRYGYPRDPEQDLPEGTIYLPSVNTGYVIDPAPVALRNYLRKLGIISEDA